MVVYLYIAFYKFLIFLIDIDLLQTIIKYLYAYIVDNNDLIDLSLCT